MISCCVFLHASVATGSGSLRLQAVERPITAKHAGVQENCTSSYSAAQRHTSASLRVLSSGNRPCSDELVAHMTNGPCWTMGSPIGWPATSRKRKPCTKPRALSCTWLQSYLCTSLIARQRGTQVQSRRCLTTATTHTAVATCSASRYQRDV